MRELKFRAKYKQGDMPVFRQRLMKEGTWVYGDLCTYGFQPRIYDNKGDVYPIDPNTIGQYTGLRDKHGNEIFEGDVVEYYMDEGDGVGLYNGVVTFCEGCFCVDEDYSVTLRAIIIVSEDYGELAVVGNIYDKKEGE